MKKKVLIAAALLAATASQAQLDKGRVLIGGSVNFGSSELTNGSGASATTAKTNSFNLAPFAGLFVRNNLLAGVSLFYGHSKASTDNASDNAVESNAFGAGLLVRRYLPISNRFFFYVNGGLNFSHGKTEYTNTTDGGYRFTSVGATLYPGLSYAFGKRVLFDAGLSNFLSLVYSTSHQTPIGGGNESKQTFFNGGIGAGGSVPLNIGFNILLGK